MLILIVDRSVQIIERLEEIIVEAVDITAVHKTVSYEEAKKLFKENKHDVVLLDVDLPKNGSLKLLKEINRKACVIILSTYTDNYYIREQCKFLGVDFFFDKYYDFEKIGGLLSNPSFINKKKGFEQIE